MNQPVRWRRPLERWRSAWPGEISDPFGEFTQLWNRIGHPFESLGEAGPGGGVPPGGNQKKSDAHVVPGGPARMERGGGDLELRGQELRITREGKGEATGQGIPPPQRH